MLMVSRMTYLQIVDYKPCWWLILCIHRIVHRNGRKPSVGRLIGSKTSLLLVSHPRMPVNMTRKQICIYDYFTFQLWDSRIFFCCSWLTDIGATEKLFQWRRELTPYSQRAHLNNLTMGSLWGHSVSSQRTHEVWACCKLSLSSQLT